MYKKILVPLDGSKLAETALPHAGAIARPLGAEVVLLAVAPPQPPRRLLEEQDRAWDANLPVGGATTPLPPDWFGRHSLPLRPQHTPEQQKEWEDYLSKLDERTGEQVRQYMMEAAASLAKDGVKLDPVVAFGKPVDQIVKYAEDFGVDLIVMSTHGQSGIGRWFAGSVAQGVLRESTCPVLLVKAGGVPS